MSDKRDAEVAAELVELHQQAERRHEAPVMPEQSELVHLADDIERELLQLHQRRGQGHCATCHDVDGRNELWPCPTLRVMRRLLRLRARS